MLQDFEKNLVMPMSLQKETTSFIEQLYIIYQKNRILLSQYAAEPTHLADIACLLLHSPENNTVNTWKEIIPAIQHNVIQGDHYGLLEEKRASFIAEQTIDFIN